MTTSPPVLVGLSPGPVAGWRMEVAGPRQIVGSAAGCDIRLVDEAVDGHHALLTTHAGLVWVDDLGSAGGTFVNEQPVPKGVPRAVRQGDRLRFATVAVRFEAGTAADFDIGDQFAQGHINNVGGNQYLVHQRDSMLRDIAATRTKARWLITLGGIVTVVGGGMFAAAVLSFMSRGARGGFTGRPVNPFGPEIAGIPSGLLGWAIAMVGIVLMIIGIVLHVVATSRRRRVDRDLPMPMHLRGSRP